MSLTKKIFSFYKKYSGPILLLFIGFQIYFGIYPGWTQVRSDFPNYYVSSRLILENQDSVRLYDNNWFQDQIIKHDIDAQGKFSPFPPPTAFVLLPVAAFSALTAKRIWLVINLCLVYLLCLKIQKLAELSFRGSLILVLCTGMALANTLMLGQLYLVLLLSMFWAYDKLSKGKEGISGIILGTGIAIKYFPLVFIPSLVQSRNFKTIFYISGSIILLNLVAAMIFGVRTYIDFFNSVFLQHLAGKLEGQSPWSYTFQSWNALSYNLFRYHETLNPSPLYPSETFFYLFKYGIQLIILFLSTRLILRMKNNNHFFDAAIILSSISVLFLSPAGATYHSLLLLFALTLFLKITKLIHTRDKIVWIITVGSIMCAGFLPLLINKIPFLSSHLITGFYRLWLMSIIYFSLYFHFNHTYTTNDK